MRFPHDSGAFHPVSIHCAQDFRKKTGVSIHHAILHAEGVRAFAFDLACLKTFCWACRQ